MHATASVPRTAARAAATSGDHAVTVGGCTCFKVRSLARRLTGLYDAALAPHGLTVTQYAALTVLARASASLSVAELGRRMQMDRTTTSRLVGPLTDEDLVERVDENCNRVDSRARPLRITPKGRRRLSNAIAAWRSAQRQVERALGSGLQAQLHRVADSAGRALAVTTDDTRI